MATAARIAQTPPHIDGVLDDEVWQQTPACGGFVQNEPIEGDPVSAETIFRIAYDEEALYVGIRCFDSDPDGLVARLTRRDGEAEADRVSLSLLTRISYWFGG